MNQVKMKNRIGNYKIIKGRTMSMVEPSEYNKPKVVGKVKELDVDVIINYSKSDSKPPETITLPIENYDNRDKFILSVVKKFNLTITDIMDLSHISCCIYKCPDEKRKSIDKWYMVNNGKFYDDEGDFDILYKHHKIEKGSIKENRKKMDSLRVTMGSIEILKDRLRRLEEKYKVKKKELSMV